METDIQATVGQPVVDARPEPPPFPTLYVCRWHEWRAKGRCSWETEGWQARTSMFHQPLAKIEEEARELAVKGCRNIRIVTIPGDHP